MPGAVKPKYAKSGDAGLDLVAYNWFYDDTYDFLVYDTGITVEIPVGYFGLLVPNSRIAKRPLLMANSPGIIDSGYRGTLKFIFKDFEDRRRIQNRFLVGDTIGQLIILQYPQIELEETDNLSQTERGTGGFGSTENASPKNMY